MSIKKDLLAEIEAKARKIRERKLKTSTREDVEKMVFDYFKEVELLGRLKESTLIFDATQQLKKNIQQKHDCNASIEVSYTLENQVQGVLITWSKYHQIKNHSEEQIYIGVEQMLFS